MKRGNVDISVAALAGVIVVAIVFLFIGDVIANSPFFGKQEFTNEDKLDVFHKSLSLLETQKNTSDYVVASNKDLFLFFSYGEENIELRYRVSDKNHKDRNIIFLRPDTEECKNKACICYSDEGSFWKGKLINVKEKESKTKGDMKYSSDGLTAKKNEDGSPSTNSLVWSGKILKCLEASDNKMIFTNSRSADEEFLKEYTDPEVSHVSLEIPILFNSEISVSDFDFKDEEPNEDLVSFSIKNYQWFGGVAIGGMGQKNKNIDENEDYFQATPYFINFEKYKDTSVTGVCTVDQCVFKNAGDAALLQLKNLEAKEKAKEDFNSLNNFITKTYPVCLKNVDASICAQRLDQEINYMLKNVDLKNIFYLLKFKRVAKTNDFQIEFYILTPTDMELIGTIESSLMMPNFENEQVDTLCLSSKVPESGKEPEPVIKATVDCLPEFDPLTSVDFFMTGLNDEWKKYIFGIDKDNVFYFIRKP